jgi:hypothetical protein
MKISFATTNKGFVIFIAVLLSIMGIAIYLDFEGLAGWMGVLVFINLLFTVENWLEMKSDARKYRRELRRAVLEEAGLKKRRKSLIVMAGFALGRLNGRIKNRKQ